jgi:outer membrane biosynthesis protein TonB
MSFFRTATEQRIKEAKSVKYFLSVSLIGSLAVHIGVLASGISNLLSVAPQAEEDKPIEISFVEPQTIETPQPQKKKQQIQPSSVPVTPKRSPVTKVDKQDFATRQPKQEVPKTTQAPQQQVEQPVRKIESQTPQNTASTTAETSNNDPNTNVLTSTANDSSVAFESSTGISDRNNNSRTSNGTSRREKRETIATEPSAPSLPTAPSPTGSDTNSSGDGRAACSECDTDYPEEARRNGVEGKLK